MTFHMFRSRDEYESKMQFAKQNGVGTRLPQTSIPYHVWTDGATLICSNRGCLVETSRDRDKPSSPGTPDVCETRSREGTSPREASSNRTPQDAIGNSPVNPAQWATIEAAYSSWPVREPRVDTRRIHCSSSRFPFRPVICHSAVATFVISFVVLCCWPFLVIVLLPSP